MVDDILKLYYGDNLSQHGFSKEALGWTKGKQDIRFHQLTKYFNNNKKSYLDIGSGLGDFITFCKKNNYDFSKYLGVEIFEDFFKYSHQKFIDQPNVKFHNGNFLKLNTKESFDYIIASGIFGNHLFDGDDEKQYTYIEKVIKKSFDISNIGISFDFLSNKITVEGSKKDFYCDPSRLLNIIYPLSKNLILDNSTMPFEFSVTVFKDESFSKDTILFNTFLNQKKDI